MLVAAEVPQDLSGVFDTLSLDPATAKGRPLMSQATSFLGI